MDDDVIRQGLRFILLMSPIVFWPVLVLGADIATIEIYDRKRFSLRGLLIVTTLVAVVLGVIAWAAR